MPDAEPSLLLLIPAYNEEDRIGPVLRDFGDYFEKHYQGDFRLVVVLNGCRDQTEEVVNEAAQRHPFISSRKFEKNIGKGGALIRGLDLEEQGHPHELVAYVDADGATGPRALHELVKHHREADCIVGSRWLPESVLHISQPWVRRVFSRVFHFLVQLFFRMGIHDTQCPAKVIHTRAVDAIHDQLLIADLAFDVNLLYSLERAGFTLREVAVEWTDMMGSKVTKSLFRSSLTMFLSIVRLRLVYSPFNRFWPPIEPLAHWVYLKLGSPPPLPAAKQKRRSDQGQD